MRHPGDVATCEDARDRGLFRLRAADLQAERRLHRLAAQGLGQGAGGACAAGGEETGKRERAAILQQDICRPGQGADRSVFDRHAPG